jgi:hypothetical protein
MQPTMKNKILSSSVLKYEDSNFILAKKSDSVLNSPMKSVANLNEQYQPDSS